MINQVNSYPNRLCHHKQTSEDLQTPCLANLYAPFLLKYKCLSQAKGHYLKVFKRHLKYLLTLHQHYIHKQRVGTFY